MKSIVFDTGPIISLTLNNLLWIIEPLHDRFGGEFYITKAVYKELIDRPLSTKKYKFEARTLKPPSFFIVSHVSWLCTIITLMFPPL